MTQCHYCRGTGAVPWRLLFCDHYRGTGTSCIPASCDPCGGTGVRRGLPPCTHCGGTGMRRSWPGDYHADYIAIVTVCNPSAPATIRAE